MTLLRGLFFMSGAAGLMYEVVWTRLFAEVVGSTATSMAAVFSVFLLGLAVGAGAAGRIRKTGPDALVLYGWIEIAIGVSAAITSLALLYGTPYLAQWSPGPESVVGSMAYSVGMSAVLLLVPTLLMGATLPIALNGVRDFAVPRRAVTQLYGWNTVGASIGTLLAGFVLIWRLGIVGTLGVAIAINTVIGAAVVLFHGTLFRSVDAADRGAGLSEPGAMVTLAPQAEQRLWPVLAFTSGFVVIAYQMLWGRIAKFLLGDRTMAVAALLFAFIGCLGIAGMLAPVVGRHFRRFSNGVPIRLVGVLFVVGALIHVVVVPAASVAMAGGALPLISLLPTEFLRRVSTVWLLIAIPTLCLGLIFPVLAWGSRNIDDSPGRTIGNLYLVNTVGAALGGIVGGIILIPWTGTMGGFFLVSLLACSAGAALLFHTGSRGMAVGALAALVVGWAWVPSDLTLVRSDEQLVLANEDAYGVQVLTRTDQGFMRVRNNRLSLIFDLGNPQTTHAQQMAAHLTALFADEIGEVLNIGTGYGITAGAYTLYPIGSVETVEILPFLVDNQERFSSENFDYLQDDRVTLIQGDGRHRLASSDRDYDIISVNVLDPYLPGSSSLYTVDFWQMAHERLRPGGVFTQLVWGADVGLLVKALESVFPTVLYFRAYGRTSFNVVAFRDRITPESLVAHYERLGPEAMAQLTRVLGDDPIRVFEQGLSEAWDLRPRLQALAAEQVGRLHSDNFPILEFRWAHGVGGVSLLDSPLVQY